MADRITIEHGVFEDMLTKMQTRDTLVNLLRYTDVYAIDLLKKRLNVTEFQEFLSYIDHDIKLFEATFPNLKEDYENGVDHSKTYEFFSYYFLRGLVNVHNRGLRNDELFKNKLALMNDLGSKGFSVLNITDAFSGAVTLTDLTILPFDTFDQLVVDYKEIPYSDSVYKIITDINTIISKLATDKESTRWQTAINYKLNSFMKAATTIYKTSKTSDEVYERLVNHNKELMSEFTEIDPGVFYSLDSFTRIIQLLVTELSDKIFYNTISGWLDDNYPVIFEELQDSVYVSDLRSYHDLVADLEDLKRKYTLPHLYI